MQIEQILAYGDKPPFKGSLSESRDPFLKYCPNHVFVIGEARHFKFRVQIDTEEYECMHDILLPKGMCSELRDLFKFSEISDNISEDLPMWPSRQSTRPPYAVECDMLSGRGSRLSPAHPPTKNYF